MRILVCGEWERERATALESLRESGHRVARAACATGPLECLLAPAPDVLLLATEKDDGWARQALRMVRRRRPRLAVIVVTGDGSIEERLRLDAARPDCVLVDPIAPGELIEAVASLRRAERLRGASLSSRVVPSARSRAPARRPARG